MRVLVLPPRGIRVGADSIWMALIHGLMEAGHAAEFVGSEGGRFDALIAVNHQPLAKQIQSRFGIGSSASALIALEPRVTSPQMYTQRVLRGYRYRYAASPIWAKSIDAIPFRWPQNLRREESENQVHSHDATLINADKRSAVKGSLYGLRRDVVRMSSSGSVSLAHFGPDWDASIQDRTLLGLKACAKSALSGQIPQWSEALGGLSPLRGEWLGVVDSKAEAFARAPVSIVIENCADYVSEKLIDAIRFGVVPVYVGPQLHTFGLSDRIAIKAVSNAREILEAVKMTSKLQKSEVLAAGREWLASEEALEHDAHYVLHALGFQIGEELPKSK